MIRNPQQRLALNGLVVSQGGGAVTHDGGFKIEALSTDSEFGDPEPIVSTLETELEDGERLQLDGYGNRELFFEVRVTAADAQGLALGEKALAEASRPGELSWLPPAPFGSETFYDVELCHLVWLWDDVDELRVTRVYGLRITAQPFGRPPDPVIIPATGSGDPTPQPGTEVLLDDCTSTTGWSFDDAAGQSQLISFTAVGDHLELKTLGIEPFPLFEIRKDGFDEDMSSTPYVRVESTGAQAAYLLVGDLQVMPHSQVGRYTYFKWPTAGNLTSLRVAFLDSRMDGHEITTRVYDFSRVTFPFSGTARQMFRSFDVHGTARTSGSLRLSHQAALGSVLVWSGEAQGGYQPPMRGYKSGGEVDVADTDAASGARTDISASPFEIEVPVDQLPDGLYRVAARVKADTAVNPYFTRTYTTVGSPLASFTPTGTVTPPHALTTDYRIVDLGTEMISGAYGSSLLRRMTVQATDTGSGATVWLDELYLLNTSTGAVVQVEAGAAKHVWINAPTVATPFPTLLGGIEADGSDAVRLDPVADIFQPAAWSPGTINLFTACGQPNLAAEAEYYPRFLHNAYEVVLP